MTGFLDITTTYPTLSSEGKCKGWLVARLQALVIQEELVMVEMAMAELKEVITEVMMKLKVAGVIAKIVVVVEPRELIMMTEVAILQGVILQGAILQGAGAILQGGVALREVVKLNS